MNKQIVVSFKDKGKKMLIVSDRRKGESLRSHKSRIKLMQGIMIEHSRNAQKGKSKVYKNKP